MYLSVLNFIETGEWVDISAKDIYKWISLGYGKGAQLRDAMARCVDPGVATESLVPSYDKGNPPTEDFMLQPITETDAIKAIRKVLASRQYRVISYTSDWIDAFAWAMLLNFGVYGGVIGSNNGTWMSQKPQVPADGSDIWGHALYFGKAVKDAKKNLAIS